MEIEVTDKGPSLRIEDFLRTIFPNQGEDITSAFTPSTVERPEGWPAITYMGSRPYPRERPSIAETVDQLSIQMCDYFSEHFGLHPKEQKLWWRERPHFFHSDDGVGVWCRIAIEGIEGPLARVA